MFGMPWHHTIHVIKYFLTNACLAIYLFVDKLPSAALSFCHELHRHHLLLYIDQQASQTDALNLLVADYRDVTHFTIGKHYAMTHAIQTHDFQRNFGREREGEREREREKEIERD